MAAYFDLESWWLPLHSYLTSNEYASVMFASTLVLFLYWGLGTLYTILELTGKPAFLYKYKVQPLTKTRVKQVKKDLPRVIGQVLFNQVVVGTPMFLVASKIMEKDAHYLDRALPSVLEILTHLGIFIVLQEIGFYYTHRLVHHPTLYKLIHKIHHEWKEPIAITAIYCHPVEQALSNLAPILWGPIIVKPHIITVCIWFTMAIVTTLNDHSGYHLPFCKSSQGHDYHHLTFNQFYGILGILDWLHGTDKVFRSSKQFQNHKIFTSLSPLPQYSSKNSNKRT